MVESMGQAGLDEGGFGEVRADKVGGGDGLPVLLNHLPDAGPGDLPPHYQGRVHQAHHHLVPPRVSQGAGHDLLASHGDTLGWRRGTSC